MSIVLPHIERLKPYQLGLQPPDGSGAAKLNQNENPYAPSPQVLAALREISEEALRRYPDPECAGLREALAELHGVKPEQVFCGNGSSEIISLLMKVFVGSGGAVALPDPAFSLYATAAEAAGAAARPVPLRGDFTVDTERLAASRERAVILINPNAPTGLVTPLADVERLAEALPGLFVIDEAYIDFAENPAALTAMPLVRRHANVIVVRTFSKAYALCGARVGYCVADKSLIAALEKGRDIYNVNAISRRLALAALGDRVYMERCAAAVRATRDAFAAELTAAGFTVLPSQTNFVLCAPPVREGGPTADELCREMMKQGIYVRHFEHPRLAGMLRISIGTEAEMREAARKLAALTGRA